MPTPRRYASAAQRQAAYRLRCREQARAARGVAPLPGQPGRRRWAALCGQALSLVELAGREMEVYYDQRSDAWQESEPGEAFGEVMESVAQIAEALSEVRSP
jgi:hypothetical protein